jgi:hypothetical protein
MEELMMNVIANLPNFAVALVMLYWQRQTIDRLMATQDKLIERLLTYVDNDKTRAAAERKATQEMMSVKPLAEPAKP